MLNDFQLFNGTNEGGYWFLPVLDAVLEQWFNVHCLHNLSVVERENLHI